jgi:hypothetical protein
VAEPQLGDELLEPVAPLALADQQQPRVRQLREQLAESGQELLVTAVGREARHGDDDRSAPELELLADRLAIGRVTEARQVGGAGNPVHAFGRQANLAAARLDLARHREHGRGAAIERSRRHRALDRAHVVEGADERGASIARVTRADHERQPVVVRVVRVHDVDGFARDQRPQPHHVLGQLDRRQPRAQVQALDERQPRLLRLGLEAVAGRDTEQHVVAERAQPADQADDGIGAARPPSIGREMQDAQRPRAHGLASPAAAARTVSFTGSPRLRLRLALPLPLGPEHRLPRPGCRAGRGARSGRRDRSTGHRARGG